ncbi:hypothetical protein VNO80_18869 [Phaseolus coccineus]|uniref:Glycine-rich protein n=1 Tax=Phaseolus coccineus TaxID=3886 RepID=A0AAN9QZS9_PHACN
MAIYGASKLMTFAVVAAIVLLMFSMLASADQPGIKLGRKLFQATYGPNNPSSGALLPPSYGSYPGGGGYTPSPPYGSGGYKRP